MHTNSTQTPPNNRFLFFCSAGVPPPYKSTDFNILTFEDLFRNFHVFVDCQTALGLVLLLARIVRAKLGLVEGERMLVLVCREQRSVQFLKGTDVALERVLSCQGGNVWVLSPSAFCPFE